MNSVRALAIPAILIGIGAVAFTLSQADDIYSVEEAVQNFDSLEGEEIVIQGEAVQGKQICTNIYCGSDNPCCNSCSASIKLRNGTEIPLQGDELGCSGNSCQINCTPVTGEVYSVTGYLDEKSSEKFFKVNDFKEVSPNE